MAFSQTTKPLHVVHLLYRFAAGGLENVIVQLVNGLPTDSFRHTIVALTHVDPDFACRIERAGVELIALHKAPGQPFRLYPAVYRLFKRLKPDVVHSCNIAALEFQVVAWAAGVPLRIHAEHGWDIADPDGNNRAYQWLRKVHQRFVHRFVVVSEQLQAYLLQKVGLTPERVLYVPNGVDTELFRPTQTGDTPPQGFPFNPGIHTVVGTVGRLEPIKNQQLLARAFVQLVRNNPAWKDQIKLVLVGSGPQAEAIQRLLVSAGVAEAAWLPGARGDIPAILRQLAVFVLPSLSEGTSCTLQEALATGLRVVATDVGGNKQVLDGGAWGVLVPSEDVDAMEAALASEIRHHLLRQTVPDTQRELVVQRYGLQRVLTRYQQLFQGE